MPRTPTAIEREPKYNVAYVRYRKGEVHAGRTIGYADHQINVDVDDDGLVGIEILSLGANELTALAEIAQTYDLDLTPLIGGTVPGLP
jgi:hypothetical protein